MAQTSNQKVPAPKDARSWMSFVAPDEDGDDRTYLVDLTFLESNYTCIYGRGCQGIEEQRAPDKQLGCCTHGAHFIDEADREHVAEHVERLDDSIWQFRSVGLKSRWWVSDPDDVDDEGDPVVLTRRVKGACIFQNRPDFEGGIGCALHHLAEREGVNPMSYKPEVCWHVPIRREDNEVPDGSIVTTLTQWDRGHWSEGGHDFGWWCIEEPEAYVGSEPVYKGFEEELKKLIGEKAYNVMSEYLSARHQAGEVSLPHPTLRKKS